MSSTLGNLLLSFVVLETSARVLIPRRHMGGRCSRRSTIAFEHLDDDEWELVHAPRLVDVGRPRRRQLPTSLALQRFRQAVQSVLRIIRKRRQWSVLGAYLNACVPSGVVKDRLRKFWAKLGKELQGLNSKALCGHLKRKDGRLCYTKQPPI